VRLIDVCLTEGHQLQPQMMLLSGDPCNVISYRWYAELQEHAHGIPTIVVANKIDVDYKVRPAGGGRSYCAA
jgi:hypothetical protein